MANICYAGIAVKGDPLSIERFVDMLEHKDVFQIGRGVYLSENVEISLKGRTEFFGEVKWSVTSALVDGEKTIVEASKMLDLEIEIFSEEGGMGFMEHFIFNKGKIVLDDVVDYFEYFFDEFETKEEAEKEFQVTFTDDEWKDGKASRGGFEWDFTI